MIINVTAIEAEGRHSPLSVQRESRMPGEERHSAEFYIRSRFYIEQVLQLSERKRRLHTNKVPHKVYTELQNVLHLDFSRLEKSADVSRKKHILQFGGIHLVL